MLYLWRPGNSGAPQLVVKASDGSGVRQVVFTQIDVMRALADLGGGRYAFTTPSSGGPTPLLVGDFSGSPAVQVDDGFPANATWLWIAHAADGGRLAFTHEGAGGSSGLYASVWNGTERTKLADSEGFGPVSPNGRYLPVGLQPGGTYPNGAARLLDFSTGSVIDVLQVEGYGTLWSADSSHLAGWSSGGIFSFPVGGSARMELSDATPLAWLGPQSLAMRRDTVQFPTWVQNGVYVLDVR